MNVHKLGCEGHMDELMENLCFLEEFGEYIPVDMRDAGHVVSPVIRHGGVVEGSEILH